MTPHGGVKSALFSHERYSLDGNLACVSQEGQDLYFTGIVNTPKVDLEYVKSRTRYEHAPEIRRAGFGEERTTLIK